MSGKASGREAATSCLAVGCACLVQVVWYAAIVAAIILAARWALATHAFGL